LHVPMLMLLQAPAPAPGRSFTIMLIYIVSFGLIAWLLLIRPQRKMQQQHQKMLSELKRNDEVLTEGGIIGTVVHIAEDRVTIKSGENTRLVIARQKIARILSNTVATA
jgi:preprotein translocase subunit YajC